VDQLWGQDFDASHEVLEKAAKIKLALFDVDGILTDGSLHITADGEQEKVFNVLDGHGLKMLIQRQVHVGVITARRSGAVDFRMRELGITHYFPGQDNKSAAFESLLSELGLEAGDCCYMGDDMIDLPVMLRCGLAITVPNAHPVVKHFADWTTPSPGGAGAVRWTCDLLLYAQNHYNDLIAAYLELQSRTNDG
jgi:3-deoxy-D-manno-octulosonate 8-phosphate phosphatase (KDO 8-P phosphatase)